MSDPTMTTPAPVDMDRLGRDLDVPDPATITKFAPPKYRGAATSLQAIQNELRRSLNDVIEHCRKLADYAAATKAAAEEQLRNLGG